MTFSNDDYEQWRNSGRKTTKQRGYDSGWKHIRAAKLALTPFCELNRTAGCSKDLPRIAETVDHRVPIRVNPRLRLEISNLRSVCRQCNNSKPFEDAKRWPVSAFSIRNNKSLQSIEKSLRKPKHSGTL